MSGSGMNHEDVERRLTRLEEAAGFGEHRVDQLHEQMAALERALRRVEERVARLEQRVDEAARGPEPEAGGGGDSGGGGGPGGAI